MDDPKERLLREGQKAYIVINAAGGAALLAFLQAIWPMGGALSLKKGVLFGIAALAAGVAVATLGYLARHWALRKNQVNSGFVFQLAHVWIPFIAVACFVAGLILPVLGGFDSLGGDRTGQIRSAPDFSRRR